MELIFNGITFTYPTQIENVQENQAKLNLESEDGNEGIWVVLHPDDLADYRANVVDDTPHRVAVTLNPSLAGIPWGVYIPYKLNGDRRPSFDFSMVDIEKDDLSRPTWSIESMIKNLLKSPDFDINEIPMATLKQATPEFFESTIAPLLKS